MWSARRLFLASADGRPVQQVATEVDVGRPMVWRWQQRFAEEGPDGLLRDKTASPASRRSRPGQWRVWRR
jgi:transposase